MDEAAYRIEARVERTLWWFTVRRRILAQILDALDPPLPPEALVLDVGCGTGANGPVLASGSRRVIGIDRASLPLRLLAEGGGVHRATVAADALALPFGDERFDAVAALDVLEHLPDDRAAARELARVTRPGGAVVIFVPAHEVLWGIQDDLAHHLRRYDERSLLAVVEEAGLEVARVTHFNALLAGPILVARRLLRAIRPSGLTSENQVTGPLINPILEGVFGLELPLLARASLPFGVSLAVVARTGRDHS